MSDYGLTDLRDSDGQRQPVEHTFEWGDDDEEVTIRFVPPTLYEVDEIEDMMNADDLSVDEIQEPLDDYLIEPSIPDGEDWTLREFQCYLQGIYLWSMGGTGVHGNIRDEIEQRDQSAAGN